MTPYLQRKTELSAHIVAFSQYLRQRGFALTPSDEIDALRAIGLAGVDDPNVFQRALKCTLARNQKNMADFDALYDRYWSELGRAVDSKLKQQEEETVQESQAPVKPNTTPSFESLKSWLNGNRSSEQEELSGYSAFEVLTKQDFSTFSNEQQQEVEQILKQLARILARKLSRRMQRSRHGGIDLRNTLRKNLRHGEEIVHLFRKKPRKNKLKLVLLCDVSKSMDLYSRFFVQFMHAFQHVYHRMETFVFSTSLYRITDQMRDSNYKQALRKVTNSVAGWSGGTDLGKIMGIFVDEFGSRFVDKKTIVIIVSDGLDTGEGERLDDSLSLLKKRAHRIFWLNPLASNENYRPETKAMKTAMPHLTSISAAHNVESLRAAVEKFV